MTNTRQFLTWAVGGAVERGELDADTSVSSVVEMLVAMLCGMAFYAGFVDSRDRLRMLGEQFRLVLAGSVRAPVVR